ncbi:right-handed parallel beta-helix repeat-containing protein [Filifactor alocis]|uniref:right-handed parallel beta-helix repeat-containing protein n=1 Tax=Filifactor alocis TaxID=143361 RepID=UPI003FA0B188
MKVDEIVKMLNIISEEVMSLKEKNQKEDAQKEEDSLKKHETMYRMARSYPIKTHLIKSYDERIQKMYLSSLIYLFQDNTNENLFWKRRLLIYRILASVDNKLEIDEYVAQSMKMDSRYLDEFIEDTDRKVKNSFVVDMLLLLSLDNENSKRSDFETVTDMIQYFQISKEELRHLSAIAKSILQQEFDSFIELIKKDDDINYTLFLGYFDKNKFSSVVTDIKELDSATGNVLVANATVQNQEEYIDLSSSDADAICFTKCTFSYIRGIISTAQIPITFDKCLFEGSYINTVSGRYEEEYTFISGENYRFINTEFINCKVSKHLLNVTNSVIRDCEIKNCEGLNLPCEYLFHLTDTVVERTKFIECKMQTNYDDRKLTEGGILMIEGGKLSDCIFEECSADGNSGYGSYAHYEMQIVLACNTTVTNCNFNDCSCFSYDSYDKTVKSYIMGLKNAVSENNEFHECRAAHYLHSNFLSLENNIGNI